MSIYKNSNKDKKPNQKRKFNFYWIYGIVAVLLLAIQFNTYFTAPSRQISYQEFEREMLIPGDVEKIVVVNKSIAEITISEDALQKEQYQSDKVSRAPQYRFEIGSLEKFESDVEKAQEEAGISNENRIGVTYETRTDWMRPLIGWIIPIVVLIAIWMFIMRRVAGGGVGGGGGQIFNIGKSKANLYDKDTKVNVTFNDVAGLDEAKQEVMEVVDFLKRPQKYTALGGKIPKGVLLVGEPGTGKTLLAKAMAGEAKVPFFTISGSDFVELFVGVGASRVRDLFKQAREKAPCIIFIDEIDAIGRARGKNMMQSNDERENTLNALLVEMDGFSSEKGVIILAATNRPDVLDAALLRPGRFDRQIGIDKPDLVGREQIFKVHLKPIKVAKTLDAQKLAAQTPGFAGAEIANVCNEAALIAARRSKTHVEMEDFNDAIDRVIGGLEKKNKLINPEEKKIIAFHEAGHALCGWYLEHADPLVKVSIIPRGMAALGYAQYLPKEQYLYTTEQLTDMMCMTLGGRAAEEIIFGRISTGAQNDLERITKMAYAMVTVYGMNDKLGNVSFYDPQGNNQFQKPYSDETAREIDQEVRKLIENAFVRTKDLLRSKKKQLDLVANALLEHEIIFQSDLEELVGKRPWGLPGHDHLSTTEEEIPAKSEDSVSNNGLSEDSKEDAKGSKGVEEEPESDPQIAKED